MKRFEPSRLAFWTNLFGKNMRSVDEHGRDITCDFLPENLKKESPEMMQPLLDECIDLGLDASAASIRRLFRLYERSDATKGQMRKIMEELQGRLVDELMSQHFLSLSLEEQERFEHWEKSWEQILGKFGEVTRDVEEMSKCFALSRYTASMFHALHVAEWGAIKLGDFIGVTDPKKGWRPTEKMLEKLVHGGHSNLPPGLSNDFEFLEQMNREITTMTLAWRNKVDHAANNLAILPTTDFTPDVAEHVIASVRVFMLRLVEGLP